MAPLSTDIPHGEIEFARTAGMKSSSNVHHMLGVVRFGETSPKHHAADVNIVRYIGSAHVPDDDAEVAFKKLDCHCRLLLTDPDELA